MLNLIDINLPVFNLRLHGVLQNQSFERMFANPKNKLDLFDLLNQEAGKGLSLTGNVKEPASCWSTPPRISSRAKLHPSSAATSSRSLSRLPGARAGIVAANNERGSRSAGSTGIFYGGDITKVERAILPANQRRPTFLWIDEASEYFDDNIDSLLIQSRKYKLGLIMAHQYLGQLPRGLPGSLMTNTSIKLVGGTSDKDTREMAREMRTAPEFIAAMIKQPNQTSFAAYVRNVTPQAMKLAIPFGSAEALPKMPEESFELLRAASRERLSLQVASIRVKGEQEAPQDVTDASAPKPPPDGNDFWEPSN